MKKGFRCSTQILIDHSDFIPFRHTSSYFKTQSNLSARVDCIDSECLIEEPQTCRQAINYITIKLQGPDLYIPPLTWTGMLLQ